MEIVNAQEHSVQTVKRTTKSHGHAGNIFPGDKRKTIASARCSSGANTVRAQSDPFRLRALPNDDIYFYSKKIDNSRVVRQADPEARGECWSAVGAAGVLLMLGASIIAPHVAVGSRGLQAGVAEAGAADADRSEARSRSQGSGPAEPRALERPRAGAQPDQPGFGSGDPSRQRTVGRAARRSPGSRKTPAQERAPWTLRAAKRSIQERARAADIVWQALIRGQPADTAGRDRCSCGRWRSSAS